jgi:hypothetical protein
MTSRLTTEWSTTDEDVARTLRVIAEFPEHSVERMQLEAVLHTWQAAELMREVGHRQGERAAHRRQRRASI